MLLIFIFGKRVTNRFSHSARPGVGKNHGEQRSTEQSRAAQKSLEQIKKARPFKIDNLCSCLCGCFVCFLSLHSISFLCPDAGPHVRGGRRGQAGAVLQPPLRTAEAHTDLWAICKRGAFLQAHACGLVCMEGFHLQSTTQRFTHTELSACFLCLASALSDHVTSCFEGRVIFYSSAAVSLHCSLYATIAVLCLPVFVQVYPHVDICSRLSRVSD